MVNEYSKGSSSYWCSPSRPTNLWDVSILSSQEIVGIISCLQPSKTTIEIAKLRTYVHSEVGSTNYCPSHARVHSSHKWETAEFQQLKREGCLLT